MNSHVAAFGKRASTSIHQAFESPLVPICLRVHDSNGLTHRFWDGFEALFLSRVEAFIISIIFLDIVDLLVVESSWLLTDFMHRIVLWGQNRSSCDSDLFIRNISSTHRIIGNCHFLYYGDNFCHWGCHFVQCLNVRLPDHHRTRLDWCFHSHGGILALCLDGTWDHWLP